MKQWNSLWALLLLLGGPALAQDDVAKQGLLSSLFVPILSTFRGSTLSTRVLQLRGSATYGDPSFSKTRLFSDSELSVYLNCGKAAFNTTFDGALLYTTVSPNSRSSWSCYDSYYDGIYSPFTPDTELFPYGCVAAYEDSATISDVYSSDGRVLQLGPVFALTVLDEDGNPKGCSTLGQMLYTGPTASSILPGWWSNMFGGLLRGNPRRARGAAGSTTSGDGTKAGAMAKKVKKDKLRRR